MASLATSWQSAKVVRTRDKISFFGGVMSLLISALLFGMAPQYVSALLCPKLSLTCFVDGPTFHILSKAYIFSPCAPTDTRNDPGITFSSIYVTTSPFWTSSISGSCHKVQHYSSPAIVFLMDHWRAPLSHGGTVSCFTTRIRSHHCSCIYMHHLLLL